MLSLRRRKGESIRLTGGIRITVLRIGRHDVRLGIDAPADVRITRDELEDLDTKHSDTDISHGHSHSGVSHD